MVKSLVLRARRVPRGILENQRESGTGNETSGPSGDRGVVEVYIGFTDNGESDGRRTWTMKTHRDFRGSI